ncbi:MAG: diguanylate cyclase [Burkholderiaceae bacterium]|nr:diguanylate cyclase [Burkholderiaceae bacterium]
MNCDAPVEAAAAQRARAALRHLAQRRLPPTPDQYAMAWRAVGGADACRGRDELGGTLGQLIAHLLRQLELPHRHWTAARKKEALGRLLAAHGSEPAALVERLNRLIDSWQSVPIDGPADPSALPRAPGPAAGRAAVANAAPAGPLVPDAAHSPPPPRLQRLVDDMTDLLVAVCDTVPALVEEEAWVRQQFDAIRDMLRPAGGVPDRRDMAQARALLRRTAEEHQRLLKMRRDSLQMMKTMIAQCIDWLRALTESSGRFGGKLNTFVEEIERSPDLPALAGTVRHLIEETRSMYAEIDASKTDFVQASERARLLEDEVSRLASELSAASAQVMTDHLTSLLNRRGLERSFDELAGRCRSERRALSLALLDVDDFKRLNDALGHQAGDDALRHLGRLLRVRVRPVDLSARYGGEEFVILLPDLDEAQAAEAVRAVQRALTSDVFLHHSRQVFITFSAGVARVRDGEALDDAVARADDAMYEAKRSGKNRVCVAARPAG